MSISGSPLYIASLACRELAVNATKLQAHDGRAVTFGTAITHAYIRSYDVLHTAYNGYIVTFCTLTMSRLPAAIAVPNLTILPSL